MTAWRGWSSDRFRHAEMSYTRVVKRTRGAWTVGRFRGAPIRLHWSLPLGALFFTRSAEPGAWLAFALVILAHELGHAVLVARHRCRVVAIDVHGLGGECSYRGDATPLQRSLIAWGGVLAQALLLAATAAVLAWRGWPAGRFYQAMLASFLWPNAMNMAFNLVPVAPLDGAEAWRLFPLLRARRRQRRYAKARAAVAAEVRAADSHSPLSTETVTHLEQVLDRARRR